MRAAEREGRRPRVRGPEGEYERAILLCVERSEEVVEIDAPDVVPFTFLDERANPVQHRVPECCLIARQHSGGTFSEHNQVAHRMVHVHMPAGHLRCCRQVLPSSRQLMLPLQVLFNAPAAALYCFSFALRRRHC